MGLLDKIKNNNSILTWCCPHCNKYNSVEVDYLTIEDYIYSNSHNPDEDLFWCCGCSYVSHLFNPLKATITTPNNEIISVEIQSEECNVFTIKDIETQETILLQDLQ